MIELIPSQDELFHLNEVAPDAETGLMMYKGRFDQETGTIIEPQLLFNSNSSLLSECPAETSQSKPAEATGRTANSSQGAPLLYQGWRNPNYEELRYVYVRDKIIVDHEGASCGTPGATKVCLGDPDEYIQYMRSHIERLGADAVYMIHNHPTGDPTPSDADVAATAYVFRNIPQLVGHIIINSGKYAFIEPNGKAYNVLPLPNLPADWIDPILQQSIHHHLLGRPARGTSEIEGWAEDLIGDNDSPVLIYLDKRLRVRGLQRAHPSIFFDKIRMAEVMPQQLIDFGVNGVAAALPCGLSKDMLDVARELICSHILWAAVGINKDGTSFGFAAEIPNPDYLGGKHRSTFAAYYIK